VLNLQDLQDIYAEARHKPALVQQRLYGETAFEMEMRGWCNSVGMYFQSFWTLTGNRKRGEILSAPELQAIADRYRCTKEVLWFRFLMGQGVTPLTGATSAHHWPEDLNARKIPLDAHDSEAIGTLMAVYAADAAR